MMPRPVVPTPVVVVCHQQHVIHVTAQIHTKLEWYIYLSVIKQCKVFLSTYTVMYVSDVIPLVNRWTCICTQDLCCSLHSRINGFLDTALLCYLIIHTENIEWCQKISSYRMEPATSPELPLQKEFCQVNV